MTITLLAVAHGTRSAAGRATIHALIEEVRRQRPGLPVELAWLDHARPTLHEALCRYPAAIVVPLLLTTGYHVRVDIPRAGGAALAVAPPLGPDPLLVHVLDERLRQAGTTANAAIVLAAAGSSDPVA